MNPKPFRVGLVAWHALPAIVPAGTPQQDAGDSPAACGSTQTAPTRFGETFGGLETAMWTLARHLARETDMEPICFLETDRPQNGSTPWPLEVEGVTLDISVNRFRAIRHAVGECIDTESQRIQRFSPHLLWQLPLLAVTRPFRSRDPIDSHPDPRLVGKSIDAWISFGVSSSSSRVVATATMEHTPSFVCVRSNAGLEDGLATDTEYRNECGESSSARRFALLRSDHVVCQSQWQVDRLKQLFDRDGLLSRNPIQREEWQPPFPMPAPEPFTQPFDVLWIGRYDDFHKRPLLMLEAAKKLPQLSFKMITNPFDPDIESRVRREAPENVELIDRIPFAQMPAVFAAAKLFVSTGSREHEGFPNVLLQAAASHTPIVSLSDHDDFLARSGAGVGCNESMETLTQSIEEQLRCDSVQWTQVDEYLDRFHDAGGRAAEFANWIRRSISSTPVRSH
ncbi:glycosyltransferase family 4 protein [Rhodopirellula sp. P2]|uniref:glycosyltransferase family 4 protein n=1 Tax=Rhodopirellula sp. P2 TaxID=2127060 RepID=UPI002368A84E|nr:glycosyltransferase family 4 protein [Rhodopirellula sp. P2]WDQ17373.1 glycosyltransferase family 4 protein [Rhodopirellula sp. P2]